MIRTSDLKDLRNIEWLNKKGSRNVIQNLIFTTFHRVLDNLVVSESMSKSLILITFIQLTTMIMNDKNTSLVQVLPKEFLYFIKFPLIYPYLKDISFLYTMMTIIPVAAFLFLSTYLFFRIYSLSEKRHKEYGGIKRFFGISMYLIDTILVIPLFGICFKFTLCGESTDLPDCNSTEYFFFLFITIVVLVSLFVVEMCVGMFFFNFDFKMRDNLSRSYNIMHLVFRIYCVIITSLDVYMNDNHQKLTTVFFMHFIFASIFCIDYYNRLPYYNRFVSEFYCIGVFGYFWISLVLLCTYLADYQLITDNMVYIILIGLGFFLYVVRTYREYFYRRLIIKEIDEIDNEIHLDARFRYLMEIVQNSKKSMQDDLLLTSIIKVHTEKCNNNDCLCKQKTEIYDPKSKQESNPNVPIFKNEVFIKNYLLMLIKDSCKKLPKSSLLHIDLFLFLFKEMNNISQVNHNIILFEKQSQQSLFVTVRYAIYRLKISIYYFLKDKNKDHPTSSIMFENIRVFDEEMKNLSKNCVKIVELYARMWDILGDPVPDLVLLERVCTKLIDEREITELVYHKILGVTKSSLNFLTLMTLYSKFIVFDDLLFIEIQEKFKNIITTSAIEDSINVKEADFKKQFILQENNRQLINMEGPFCSISISFNSENLGQIVWSSESCQQIFEFESNYLRTFNVAHIIPGVIAKHHNTFLTNYFELGREKLLNHLSHLWALNKNKCLFSIFIILKTFISREGLTVISLIRKLNENDYILVSKKGRVDSCGKKLRELLKPIQQDFYDKNSLLNIMSFAPRLVGMFLPYIYDYPEFTFNKVGSHEQFIEQYLSRFYIFVHKDMEKKVQMLAESISILKAGSSTTKASPQAYFAAIYDHLASLKNENLDAAYKVTAKIKKRQFQKGVYVWEFKILSVSQYALSTNGGAVSKAIWDQEFSLFDRLKVDDVVLAAIKIMKNKGEKDANKEENNDLFAGLIKESKSDAIKNVALKRAGTIKKLNQTAVLEDPKKGDDADESNPGKTNPSGLNDKDKVPALGNQSGMKIFGGLGKGLLGGVKRLANIADDDNSDTQIQPNAGTPAPPVPLPSTIVTGSGTLGATKLVGKAGAAGGLKASLLGAAKNATESTALTAATTITAVKEQKAVGTGNLKLKQRFMDVKQGNKAKDKQNSDNAEKIKVIENLPDLVQQQKRDEDTQNEGNNQNFINDGESLGSSSSKFSKNYNNSEFEKGRDKILRLIAQNFKPMVDKNIDGSSIGSTMSNQFVHRDTLKKIRLCIKSKSAPTNLKSSTSLIAICLFFCSLVNIICKSTNTVHLNNTLQFLWNTKNLTEILIKYNKLNSYIEFSRMQSKYSVSNDYEMIYSQNMTNKINFDVNNTLTSMMLIKDNMVTESIKQSEVPPIQQFFFYRRRDYTMNNSKVKEMPTVSFLDQANNILYSYIKNGYGNIPGLSSTMLTSLCADIITSNENRILEFNLEYFAETLTTSGYLSSILLTIGIVDIAVRVFILLVCVGVAIPILFVSMQKSGEILQMISKISANNIQFYNNHYNKLISLLNNGSQNVEDIITKIADAYTSGLKEKEKKERNRNSGYKSKVHKDSKKKTSIWIMCGILLFIGLCAVQCAKAIFNLVSVSSLTASIDSIVKIPNTVNSYSAINLLTFKLLSYPLLGYQRDAEYDKSITLMRKVMIGLMIVL